MTVKTSVRAGFGMFDVLPLPYMIGLNALQTAPDGVEIDLSNPGQGTYPNGLGPSPWHRDCHRRPTYGGAISHRTPSATM